MLTFHFHLLLNKMNNISAMKLGANRWLGTCSELSSGCFSEMSLWIHRDGSLLIMNLNRAAIQQHQPVESVPHRALPPLRRATMQLKRATQAVQVSCRLFLAVMGNWGLGHYLYHDMLEVA